MSGKFAPKGTFLYEWGKGRFRIFVYADGKGGTYSENVVEGMDEVDRLISELAECAENFRALMDELEAVCIDECYSDYVNQDTLPASVEDHVIDWANKKDLYTVLHHDILPQFKYDYGELLNVIERSFYAKDKRTE